MTVKMIIAKNKLPTAKEFGRVALLIGGWSAEREVSLKGGRAVFSSLQQQGVNVHLIDADKNIFNVLKEGKFDRVFNMLHGPGGEDGIVQSVCELLELPYTGSGVLASALAMDKLHTKQIWAGMKISTPEYQILNSEESCKEAFRRFGLPMIVKPILEGSSVGMSKVETIDELIPAWHEAAKYGVVIVERWISGSEYTVSILQDMVLPFIRVETKRKFYDYQAKYIDNDTKYNCPCGLTSADEKNYAEMVLQAYKVIGVSGWGRVDFIMDNRQQPWFIEVNTIPGMTDHSLMPMAAKQAGIDFNELVIRILATSFDREKERVHGA